MHSQIFGFRMVFFHDNIPSYCFPPRNFKYYDSMIYIFKLLTLSIFKHTQEKNSFYKFHFYPKFLFKFYINNRISLYDCTDEMLFLRLLKLSSFRRKNARLFEERFSSSFISTKKFFITINNSG